MGVTVRRKLVSKRWDPSRDRVWNNEKHRRGRIRARSQRGGHEVEGSFDYPTRKEHITNSVLREQATTNQDMGREPYMGITGSVRKKLGKRSTVDLKVLSEEH